MPILYNSDGEEINTQYGIFYLHITDSAGEPLNIDSLTNYGGGSNEEGLKSGSIIIDIHKEIQGPIILQIIDYPARIRRNLRLE